MSEFVDDTAAHPLGDGRYQVDVDRRWWIERGPNGGFLAALVLRAILAEVDDADRPPRSLTLHYLRPPVAGPAEVAVQVVRAGRGLSTVEATMGQGDRLCVRAIAALGVQRPGPEFADLPVPDVPPPEALEPMPPEPVHVPIRDRYQTRPAFGGRLFEPGAEALTGGWIRADGNTPVDHVLVAALTDGWLPAVFARADVPVGVPTIDLTIHFREQPPLEPGWCLVRFRSNIAAEGYIEEDGEVWSSDGRLLAQSRQLGGPAPAGLTARDRLGLVSETNHLIVNK